MINRLSRLHWLLVLGATLGAPGAEGGAPPSAASVDATLTVRLATGRSTYAVGERIPLELAFRGRAGADYYFSTSSGDRGPGLERFLVTPGDGVLDPLEDLFSSFGIAGSVLSGWQPLDGTPLVLRADLNEWARFTRPGEYQLSLESRRLQRYSRAPAPLVVSNSVAIRVVEAPRGWAAAEQSRALAFVAGGDGRERKQALSVLRYLGTKDAGLALVRHYGEGGDELRSDWFAGVVASPFRRDVVGAMEARVDAGEPLPAGFVGDLARMRSLLDFGAGTAQGRERFEAQQAASCDYTRRFVSRLRERPSAAGLAAALASAGDGGEGCDTGLASLLAAHPSEARDGFNSLPATAQAMLLQYGWDEIAGTWTLPSLLELYRGWVGDLRFSGAGDHALRRIVELDPVQGRSLAIAEIVSGTQGITADTLLALVEDPLPGLDDALRARYAAACSDEGRAATMWLVARHGSAGLVPFVKGTLERDAPCELEAAALAYLLAHDPAGALERLQPEFDRRGSGFCVVPAWSSLAPRLWDQGIESAALAHLDRGSTRQVVDAAQVLGQHGSAAVEQPLLRRLVRWNEQWRGRDAELAALTAGPPPFDSPILIEGVLSNALLEARSFTLTADEVARVRSLCLTGGCRDNVDARATARAAR